MEGFLVLLALGLVVWFVSRAGYRPRSIREAPTGSFLAYKNNGEVEYQEGISDDDAGECAADRLCGDYTYVEHKFENGSTITYTRKTMQQLGW
jgi:hypothetical protein